MITHFEVIETPVREPRKQIWNVAAIFNQFHKHFLLVIQTRQIIIKHTQKKNEKSANMPGKASTKSRHTTFINIWKQSGSNSMGRTLSTRVGACISSRPALRAADAREEKWITRNRVQHINKTKKCELTWLGLHWRTSANEITNIADEVGVVASIASNFHSLALVQFLQKTPKKIVKSKNDRYSFCGWAASTLALSLISSLWKHHSTKWVRERWYSYKNVHCKEKKVW